MSHGREESAAVCPGERKGPFPGTTGTMKKNKQHSASGLSQRLHFPGEERRLPWLSPLLDAYAIADTGVAVAIRHTEKKQKMKLACGKGCGSCCVHQKDLPLYPHEIVGIYWYASEKLSGPVREQLKNRLAAAASGCPFLIDNSCAIHPVRPIGCRQFNVFSAPCAPGEDPYYTRRDDVLAAGPESMLTVHLRKSFRSTILKGKGTSPERYGRSARRS